MAERVERTSVEPTDPVKERIRAILKNQNENPSFDKWKWDDEFKNIAELTQSKEYDPEIFDLSRELMVRFLGHSMVTLDAPKELLDEVDEFFILNEDVKALPKKPRRPVFRRP